MKTELLLILAYFYLLFPISTAVKCYNGSFLSCFLSKTPKKSNPSNLGTYHRGVSVINCQIGCYEYREDRQGFGLIFWDLWYQKLGCREADTDCNVSKREKMKNLGYALIFKGSRLFFSYN